MAGNKFLTALALGTLLMVALSCDEDTPEFPPEDNYCHYMPTDVGNWWEYAVTVENMFNPREEYKLKYEITSKKNVYKGFEVAYVITVTSTKEGVQPSEVIVAAGDEDKCYVERAIWSYLIEDDVVKGGWSQTGLVVDFPLQYRRDENVVVPKGKFEKCKNLHFDNGNEVEPENWDEYYAEGVGLVKYANEKKEYEDRGLLRLIDWRTETHELVDCSVVERKEAAF
ncbi:MAG: hypothetical protein GTN49_12390 [candidate division Zixibacteria bacterium]|nr:hypothetical protein [candidate division Zixibacteria bacterium]